MACLGCLNCLGYEDGQLSGLADEDQFVTCNADGELTLVDDATVFSDCVALDPELIDNCDNGIRKVGTRMWMHPTPKGGCTYERFRGFIGVGQPIGANDVLFTAPYNVPIPAADDCYDTKFFVYVTRFIDFDQDLGTDYGISDQINGVLSPDFPTVQRFRITGNRHNSQHLNSYKHCLTKPAGAGTSTLPLQIRIRTYGAVPGNIGIAYGYGFDVCILKSAMRG